ncbi:MAG: triose-phosphate isomerase [Gammaproteobacteria bacterium]
MAATWCAQVARALDRLGGPRFAAAGAAKVTIANSGPSYFGNSATESSPEFAVCPPYVLITDAVDALAGSRIGVGAQDVDANECGAFTGQISARMLVDAGCRYVIIGHSERRARYHESDESAAQKAMAAAAVGLCAILCVGETRDERDSGATEAVIARQVDALLDVLCGGGSGDGGDGDGSGAPIVVVAPAPVGVIAYEPLWAIGSGSAATPKQAQAAHHFIRARIASRDAEAAAHCRILYGGSVTGDNAAALLAQPDIDGALVGGASLQADDFLAICHAA